MYTLFFTKHSFGKEFFKLTEMSGIDSFFNEAENGMKITSNTDLLINKFSKLKNQSRIERLASFLQILDLIQQSEKTPLSSFVYHKKYTDVEGKRVSIHLRSFSGEHHPRYDRGGRKYDQKCLLPIF